MTNADFARKLAFLTLKIRIGGGNIFNGCYAIKQVSHAKTKGCPNKSSH